MTEKDTGENKSTYPPIIYPEDLDFRLKIHDPSLPAIAGYTSLSLERIRSSVQSGSFALQPYRQAGFSPDDERGISAVVSEQVFHEVIGKPEEPPNTIQENRMYGINHALRNVLAQMLGDQESLAYAEESIYIISEIARGLASRRRAWTDAGKLRLYQEVRRGAEKEEQLDQFRKLFPTIEVFSQLVEDSTTHKGVQVLYAYSPEFVAFLKSAHVQPIDDSSFSIPVAIDKQFILFLSPLGQFEQDFFANLPL